MIGIVGALVLVPLALVSLAYGLVKFAVSLLAAVGDALLTRMLPSQ